MNEILKLEKEEMQGSIPKDLPMPKGYVLAGGAVRRWFLGEKQDSDFDYFHIGSQGNDFIDENYSLIYKNKINETYRFKGKVVQIIKNNYSSIEELLNSFDFHHCQFAYDGDEIYTTKNAIISSIRKHLSFNKSIKGFELDTLRRAFKYQRQGYTPCLGTLEKLAMMFSEITQEQLREMTEMSPSGGKRSIVRFD